MILGLEMIHMKEVNAKVSCPVQFTDRDMRKTIPLSKTVEQLKKAQIQIGLAVPFLFDNNEIKLILK